MTVVVDYGMGNLRNVRRALLSIGETAVVSADPAVLAAAERLVLPGVGAFGEAVRRIDALDLRGAILRHVESGRPLLGVCLGMQLLFSGSDESPEAVGLGLLAGRVARFGAGLKVPHIGWNDVVPAGPSPLFPSPGRTDCFYFVHSYHPPDTEAALAHTTYGKRFTSAVGKKNVFGVQFHPEKSQGVGMELLKGFLAVRALEEP